jgi:hypothetical protein
VVDVLNLDELSSDKRKTLRVDGKDHESAELTVQQYIDRVRRSKSIPTDASMDVQIEETVVLLDSVFPTVTKDRFGKMPLSHLNKIIEFALQAPEEIAANVEKASEEETAAGNAPKGGSKKGK